VIYVGLAYERFRLEERCDLDRRNLHRVGAVAHAPWVAFAMSWAGAVFDLSVPFLLAHRRTRPFAYAAACAFHLVTWRLFPIGMFPFFMMAFGLVFFDPGWPRSVARRLGLGARTGSLRDAAGAPSTAGSPQWAFGAALALVAVEILVPLRGLLYPGDPLWTEQGFRFAWKVMLVEKNGDVVARVTDRASGATSLVEPRELYTPLQVKMMATQPDLLLQFAHAVRDRERARGRDVEVRLDAFVAMNGRRSQRFVDRDVDLARLEDGWRPKDWVLPVAPAAGRSLLAEERSSVSVVLARAPGSAQGPSHAVQPGRRQP